MFTSGKTERSASCRTMPSCANIAIIKDAKVLASLFVYSIIYLLNLLVNLITPAKRGVSNLSCCRVNG